MTLDELLTRLDDPSPPKVVHDRKGSPAAPPNAAPAARTTHHEPKWAPAILICPDSLTLRDIEIDIANPLHNGTWFQSRDGSKIGSRFIAHPGLRPRLEELISQVEVLRTKAIHIEHRLLGKAFGLSMLSRKALVNHHTAPVAVTPDLFCSASDAAAPAETSAQLLNRLLGGQS